MKYIEPACERGLRALEAAGYPVRRVFAQTDIGHARSTLASRALHDGFEEILWIDSDIVFDANDVDKLRAHDAPIVGGVYAVKGNRRLALVPLSKGEIVLGESGGLLEVRYLGTGFMLTRRTVYDTIRRHHDLPSCSGNPPVVPYFRSVLTEDPALGPGVHYLGEDYSFCQRARAAGLGVWVDTSIRLGHIGPYVYHWEDAGAPPRTLHDSFIFEIV